MINGLIFLVIFLIALAQGSILLIKFFWAMWLISQEKRDNSSKPD